MEIQILEQKANTLRFLLKGSDTAFANALRRTMMAEVPSMAIDDVVVIENTSMLYDEVIAQRLGLVPLKTEMDAYVLPEDCDCKSELGCSRCRASFTVDVEAESESVTVYSSHVKSEENVTPVSGSIPIVRLGPYQKLKLEAYAKLGRGLEHAKWQPVSACTYKYLPKVTVRAENLANPEEIIHVCPTHVYASDAREKIAVKDELACTLCMDCVQKAVPLDSRKPFPVNIEGDETSFIFNVESTGGFDPSKIVIAAAKILDNKASSLVEQLSDL